MEKVYRHCTEYIRKYILTDAAKKRNRPQSAGHKPKTCGCPGELVKLHTSLTQRTKRRAAHNALFIQNCYS